jgi:hypothetical protein
VRAPALVRRALQLGSQDNITAVVLNLRDVGTNCLPTLDEVVGEEAAAAAKASLPAGTRDVDLG